MAENVDIQYTVSLNDLFSAKLKTIESNVDRLEKKLSSLGSGGNNGGHGKSLTTGSIAAGVAFGQAAYGILSSGAHKIFELGSDVMAKGIKMQLLRSDVDILAGKGGPELFKKVQDYASNSMFGMGAFETTKQMLAYGFKAENIMPMLKSMGNIAGTDESKLKRLIYAASEIQSGDVSKMHIRQLMMAGLPMSDLAKAMHTNTKQLAEDIKKHKITSDMLIRGIQIVGESGRFNGRMESLMDTPAGRVTQLKTNWDLFKANVGEGILATSGFKNFLDEMNKVFNLTGSFRDKFVQFGSDIFDALTKVVKKIETFVDNGGLDKLLGAIKFVADNIIQIGEALIAAKIVGIASSAAGSFAASGIGGGIVAAASAFLPEILAAGVVIAAVIALVDAVKGDEAKPVVDGVTPQQQAFMDKLRGTLNMETGYARTQDVTDIINKQGFGEILSALDKRLPDVPVDKVLEEFTKDIHSAALLAYYKPGAGYEANKEFYAKLDYIGAKLKDQKLATDKLGKEGYNLTTEESKVTGSRPIKIEVNIQDQIRNMFQGAIINSDNPAEAMGNLKDAVLTTMSEIFAVAESYADANQP